MLMLVYSIDDLFIEGQRFSNIIFNIQEGNKIKLKNISITGNNAYSDRKILKQFKQTSTQKWYRPWKGKLIMINILKINFY